MGRADNSFEYKLDQCDVEDKQLLNRFRKKRTQWIEWFQGDKYHSIQGQIHQMMWDDAVHNALNEARRFANPSGATNGVLGDFIDRAYLSGQVLSICMITERPARKTSDGVISLPTLLGDVRKNRSLVTRENFVSYNGLPYDYETVKQVYVGRMRPGQVYWSPREGPEAFNVSERRHQFFDEMSRTSDENRSRNDLMPDTILDGLDARFKEVEPILKKIRTMRNKSIGHAADENSRPDDIEKLGGLSRCEISDTHRAIIHTANAVGEILGTTVGDPIPIPQFDVFNGLEMPFICSADMDKIRKIWNEHMGKTERENRFRPSVSNESR